MKKTILLITYSLLSGLCFSQKEINSNTIVTNSSNIELNQIDFNYLNKGYWELEANGYQPRADLKLYRTYAAKQDNNNWYFMVHKVCKESKYLGYMISGKLDLNSTVIHNIYFFKQPNKLIENHNKEKIRTLPTMVQTYFLTRTTTISLYNLDENCQ